MVNNFISKLAKVIGYVFAGSLIVGSLTFAYSMLAPVDVLRDWSLTATQKSYTTGEEVVFRSHLTKVMDTSSAPGNSMRWLICEKQRYPINEAIASNPKGTMNIEIHMIIPENVTQLPKSCFVRIEVRYYIFGYRPFTETVDSNSFIVTRSAQ